MKYEESGRRGLDVYYLVPDTPPPLDVMEFWAWRGTLALVFESKGVRLKCCGIRSYEFRLAKVVFNADRGLWCPFSFQRTLKIILVWRRRTVGDGRTLRYSNQGISFAFGGQEVCDGRT